ncbi:MAG: hypothetical protein FWE68_01675 [Defluviitaleaceae bacterium]|nr:hypothetical protein [Defluviitaleaceae bacterium]
MTNRENFLKAITFDKPERVPINAEYNPPYRGASDAFGVTYKYSGDNEWGYGIVKAENDKTNGQVKLHPVKTVEGYDNYKPPALSFEKNFAGLKEQASEIKAQDKFVFGLTGSILFERMHFIRGYSELMEDMYMEEERFNNLARLITEYQETVIHAYADAGVDAIWGGDDWGLQDRLMISPKMWRKLFKPWYARIFGAAKKRNLKFYMHSCGYIVDILDDLIEVGLDVIEVQQPTVLGVEALGKRFGGRICFSCPVDIQKVMPTGDRAEIERQAALMKECFGSFNGGLIYLYYPDYNAIGVDDADVRFMGEMYEKYRKYQ